jgi:hypothetical protein
MVSQTNSNGRFPMGGGSAPAPAKIRAKFGSINSSYSNALWREGMLIFPIPGGAMSPVPFGAVDSPGDPSDSASEREPAVWFGEPEMPPAVFEVEASPLPCFSASRFDSLKAHFSACSSVRSLGSPSASSSKSSSIAFSLPFRLRFLPSVINPSQ